MSKDGNMHGVNRREFITRVTGGTIGAGLGLSLAREGSAAPASDAKLEKRNEQSGMIYRPFGKTGLNVSRLTFGCIRLTDDGLPAMEMAIERGVNLVHISNGYVRRQSIASLGKFLQKPSNRDKVWIALKGIDGQGLFADIDDQLKILNTDHVDIYCNPVSKPDLIRSEAELAKFDALKKAGKVRFLNLTSHANVQEAMTTSLGVERYSSILATIDLSNVAGLKATIQSANKSNVGVMAMKSGRNKQAGGPDKIAPALFAAGVTTVLKTRSQKRPRKWPIFQPIVWSPPPTDCAPCAGFASGVPMAWTFSPSYATTHTTTSSKGFPKSQPNAMARCG
jgi:hypothetical protein